MAAMASTPNKLRELPQAARMQSDRYVSQDTRSAVPVIVVVELASTISPLSSIVFLQTDMESGLVPVVALVSVDGRTKGARSPGARSLGETT
jgi:hypothetical protein